MAGRRAGGPVGRRAGILKVRSGLGETERQRDRETERQREIETELTIKIPSKAQLVYYNIWVQI